MPVKIAIDAMGGDHAPGINIEGALLALEQDADLALTLVGHEPTLRAQFEQTKRRIPANLAITHAEEVISMEDHGAAVIRKKKSSSIHVGLQLLKEKHVDAFISAGNSGAVMAGALLLLGRLENVERPAILVRLPTLNNFVILLDAGANVDCKPSHLLQFAVMGSVYADKIEGIVNPKVALLSNGSEEHKGNELTREAHALIAKQDLNYLGYVEGFDLFRCTADVVVCDGFVGNIVLKLSEGLADMAFQWFKREIKSDVLGLIGAGLMQKTLKNFKRKFDYQPYGAAPLLGVEGMVLISHGSSTAVAIRNGIFTAKRGVEQNLTQTLAQNLKTALATEKVTNS